MEKAQKKLEIVKEAIEDWFNGEENQPESEEFTGGGVFVTLHLNGRLRGCIGCLEGTEPVDRLIYKYARAAAFNDPRFPPVTRSEVDKLKTEITLLSPFSKVDDINEIEIGRDGLYLKKGFRSGIFLPQVPVEQNWDLNEYLEQLCTKAGLPPESLKEPDTELYQFTGEIIKSE